MSRVLPAGVWLDGADCATLDRILVRVLRDAALRDGAIPARLADIVAPIHAVAAEFRKNTLVNASSGTGHEESGSVRGPSTATERLSVPEAARLANVSESYLRRLARRGTVHAVRSGSRGGWVLDGGSVAVWAADRKDLRKAG